MPAAAMARDCPVDGKRIVQVGENAEVNFVIALSVTFPTFTDPLNSKLESALNHARSPLAAELRTTEETAPDLETFMRNPSRIPANFFPPKVSVLDPKSDELPSLLRTTALMVVFPLPT